MRLRLAPWPFSIGLCVGLAALSWLGSTVESRRLVQKFVRFHQFINVESGYFPTARQVHSILSAAIKESPDVFVIVGGTSVFHGVGQHESLIWTKFLQEYLGPQFRVINFAQRAGNASDFGNIAAEILISQSRPVIYVADAAIYGVTAASLERSFFRYIVLDAWQRGYLLAWPPRDKILSEAAWRGPQPLRAPALGAMLDRYLNFNDLWEYVSYEYISLNWNPLVTTRSFEPRANFPDREIMPEQYLRFRYKSDFDQAMKIVKSQIVSPTSAKWRAYMELTDQFMPMRLRLVTLEIVLLNSPYYLESLNPADRTAFINQADEQARQLQQMGFNQAVVATKDFTADDYIDRVHLSVSGGQKLAARLAPVVRDMAVKLKYLR
jgi:hypothetical protein